MNSKDLKLIKRLKKGDRESFKKIYLAYYEPLCEYVVSFSKDKYIAENIVQEILIKLWTDRENIYVHTSLKSFLYKAAYNSYIDHFRKQSRINKKLEEIHYQALNKTITDNSNLQEDRLFLLRQAIDKLPDRCKEVFLLSKIEGYKYKEIANKLEISIKTVENQMGKALSRIREELLG